MYQMHIEKIIITQTIQEKLISKHHVTVEEARHTLLNRPRIRFAEQGHIPGEDVYAAFGRTFDGRYLVAFFVYKPSNQTAIIISVRDMTQKERRSYGKK